MTGSPNSGAPNPGVADGRRPLLGVSCCLLTTGPEPMHRVIDRYIRAPAAQGDCDVVLVPALPGLTDWAALAERLDGLLLTGSPSNVEPWRYGASTGDGPFDPARDTTTLALADAMLRAGKPVFGICRGFQELNVAFGGSLRTLDQGAPLPHHAPEGADLAAMFAHEHPVTLTPGGLMAQGLGQTTLVVNSVHFQGVDALAPGLTVEAVAEDGLVEAFSAKVGRGQVLAVQWHPEWDAATNPASAWFFRQLHRAMAEAVAPVH